ncbi:MAG: serine/threonine-protein kinase, partial [Pseudomonadota bacterium]
MKQLSQEPDNPSRLETVDEQGEMLDLLGVSPGDGQKDLLLGRKFGNYQLEEVLGVGGMGTVYRAIHPALGKQVAIKVLSPEMADDRTALGRLIDEARAAAAIGHENIVEIFDFGETEDGITYIAMELLIGETLDARLKSKGRLSPEQAVGMANQICGALGAAHCQGIIHRDIKPQNIFISKGPGGRDQVKVLDFGVAKLLDAAKRISPKTATGAVVGSPFYMSPEQANGEPLDGRSDLFSLAAVLYQALSGSLPFSGKTFTEVLSNLATVPVKPMVDIAPDMEISPALDQVILRALSKKPASRQPDMETFAKELEAVVAGEVIEDANVSRQGSPVDMSTAISVERGIGKGENARTVNM